jgi:hypothetical protein
VEDSGLPRLDTAFLGEWPLTFQREIVTSFSVVKRSIKNDRMGSVAGIYMQDPGSGCWKEGG